MRFALQGRAVQLVVVQPQSLLLHNGNLFGERLMTVDISNLRSLPVADKLRIVTQLWDDIAASTETILIPSDILQETARRSLELKADPSIAIDDEELWRRVDG